MDGWIVEAAKLTAAEVEIIQAVAAYKEAANKAKAAGDALAAKWEGDAREAFVAEQENAYRWHISISDIVSAFAETLKSVASRYEEAERNVSSIIKNH